MGGCLIGGIVIVLIVVATLVICAYLLAFGLCRSAAMDNDFDEQRVCRDDPAGEGKR
jgi:hypothetical protein